LMWLKLGKRKVFPEARFAAPIPTCPRREMAEASPSATPAAKHKSQEELIKLYAGADGTLDDIDKMMMKYDADCTGSFSIAEVKTIIHDLEASKSAVKNLGRALAGTVIVALAVIGALIGLMIMSIEVTKENRTTGGSVVDLEGTVVTTGQAEEVSSIFDIPKFDMTLLGTMKLVSCYVDFSSEPDFWPDMGASAESPSLFHVKGVIKSADEATSATLLLPNGRIHLDSQTQTGKLIVESLNGSKTFEIFDSPASRRLESKDQVHEWLKCAEGEACSPKPMWKMRKLREARQLRRGGALMTSGSFTMSSASNRSGNS